MLMEIHGDEKENQARRLRRCRSCRRVRIGYCLSTAISPVLVFGTLSPPSPSPPTTQPTQPPQPPQPPPALRLQLIPRSFTSSFTPNTATTIPGFSSSSMPPTPVASGYPSRPIPRPTTAHHSPKDEEGPPTLVLLVPPDPNPGLNRTPTEDPGASSAILRS